MTIDRRQFIKGSLATAFGCSSVGMMDSFLQDASAATAPSDFKTLICVYLNGGNDSYNMLMPYSTPEYNAYASARGAIAFERSRLLPINSDFAVNPNMPGLQELYGDGHASFLANVGTLIEPMTKADFLAQSKSIPASLGAHNAQTFYWQADHTNDENTTQDGWGGRVANEFINQSRMPITSPINSGYNLFLSHADQGAYNIKSTGVVSMEDQTIGRTRVENIARRNVIYELTEQFKNHEHMMVRNAASTFEDGLALNLQAQTLLADLPDLDTTFIGDDNNSFQTAAKLTAIRKELGLNRQILYIQMNSFDTHFEDGLAFHDNNMTSLSANLAALNSALIELGTHDSVVTFTASEFARTLSPVSGGTDHAWGGNHIIMGGPVKGGEVYGTYPELVLNGPDDINGIGRMLPTTALSQYSATLAKWFGVPENQLTNVFPNLSNFAANTRDLGFLV